MPLGSHDFARPPVWHWSASHRTIWLGFLRPVFDLVGGVLESKGNTKSYGQNTRAVIITHKIKGPLTSFTMFNLHGKFKGIGKTSYIIRATRTIIFSTFIGSSGGVTRSYMHQGRYRVHYSSST